MSYLPSPPSLEASLTFACQTNLPACLALGNVITELVDQAFTAPPRLYFDTRQQFVEQYRLHNQHHPGISLPALPPLLQGAAVEEARPSKAIEGRSLYIARYCTARGFGLGIQHRFRSATE